MLRASIRAALLVCMTAAVHSPLSHAYEVPYQDSKARYFYVFGPEGQSTYGAEKNFEQTLFFDVPEAENAPVTISVQDADTGGMRDWKINSVNEWDTQTSYKVFGASLLDEKTAGTEPESLTFGPYDKSKGEKVGNFYRFRLEVKGVSGDDANLFSVRAYPDSAEIFSEQITFRLVPDEGDRMYFYPAVPAGTKKIIVENWDLDVEGGTASMHDLATGQAWDINDSTTGVWTETEVNLDSEVARRLEIVIVKGTQRHGHAGLRVKDASGKLLPVYFKRGPMPVKAVKAKPAPKPAPEKAGPVSACNTFTFDARSSYDQNNDKIDYLWDFGDGNTSTEPVVTHVYQKGGSYDVKLTVTDNSGLECETSVTSQSVDVNTPPAAALEAPELVCAGEEVKISAAGSKDMESSALNYRWSFADGTAAEGQTVTKSFAKGGTYNIQLTVDDGQNTSCSTDAAARVIRVNTPPSANAGKDIAQCLTDPNAPFKVVLDAAGSSDSDNDALTYAWDLGDGSQSEGKRVEHVYAKGGDYTARVTVRDGSGSQCSMDTATVNVRLNRTPLVDAGQDIFACTGASVTLDGSRSIGEGVNYAWDFGDGTTGTGANATHTYQKGGMYTAVLTADDGKNTNCSMAQDRVSVRINSSPVAALEQVDNACTGDKVVFDASKSYDADGDSLTYTWDFGDGTVVDGGSQMSHRYEKGGRYQVSVRVKDGTESACSGDSATVSVKVNTPPVADAGQNLVCCQDAVNAFDGSGSTDADGDTLTYRWTYGDGESGEGARVQHAYKDHGSYDVRLVVDDQSGTSCSMASDGFVANVNAKPVAVIKVKQH